MKLRLETIALSLFLILTACSKDEQKNDKEINSDAIVNADEPQSFVKDSFTYYNGLQKNITINSGDYFGFVFEADQQDLLWKFDQSLGRELAYVSESFEPVLEAKEKSENGKQYFTFKAEGKGKTKLQFRGKNANDLRVIEVNIQ